MKTNPIIEKLSDFDLSTPNNRLEKKQSRSYPIIFIILIFIGFGILETQRLALI